MTATVPTLVLEPKAISITQYEALTSDIQIAQQDAIDRFDYEDSKGNKAARSYIATLRKLRARVESARKEAKAYALEYGRAVDAQAKSLEAEVLALIEPHQQALDAIEQREKERVASHQATLHAISTMVQKGSEEGSSSNAIEALLAGLDGIDTDDMEEFSEAAEAEKANGMRLLSALLAAAREREKREELEQIEAARQAMARRQQEEADRRAALEEAARQARIDAEARAAAQVAEANRKAQDAEARAAAAENQRRVEEQVRQQDEARRRQLQREAEEAARNAQVRMRNELASQLSAAMAGRQRLDVVEAILDGTLHPAISIDWGKVA